MRENNRTASSERLFTNLSTVTDFQDNALCVKRGTTGALKGKDKVSRSLTAVGAVGIRVPLYSKWKAEPIPLLSLPDPFLIPKK